MCIRDSKVFEYYYDAQGVIGFKYDGNVYYYKKNLLGDIDRIYDANKNLVAEYKYDAWGNHRIYTSGGIDITENMSYNSSAVSYTHLSNDGTETPNETVRTFEIEISDDTIAPQIDVEFERTSANIGDTISPVSYTHLK